MAIALGIAAVVTRWGDVAAALGRLHLGVVALATLCVMAAAMATMLAWRALLADLGSPLSVGAASRVFFLSQLGKYLPGSVWPLLAQVEMGREHQVPARRSAVVGLLTLALALAAGLICAAVTLPLVSPAAARRYGWVLILAPLLLAGLHPRVLNPALAVGFRIIRRTAPEPLSWRGIGRGLGWSLVSWAGFGAQVWLLMRDLGGTGWRSVPLAVGAFAFAWSVGFLVVFAPAGAGVREAVLTLALAPALSAGPALVLALVSRAIMTVADLLLAAGATLGARRQRGASAPASLVPD
ncbi:MAG: flippase-like domain-containing protein [Actinobacteria bacterium]|nr:flippase-like domain-containing protein [Actinomycetota bacterium]